MHRVVEEVMDRFRPEAIVCQCGTDGLVNDPLGTFNLTPSAYVSCVSKLRSYKLPTLFLGGGGYNKPNAARCFAAILAELRGIQLPGDIPEHDVILDGANQVRIVSAFIQESAFSQSFERYGPSFELGISRGLRRDENTPEYIRIITEQVLGECAVVRCTARPRLNIVHRHIFRMPLTPEADERFASSAVTGVPLKIDACLFIVSFSSCWQATWHRSLVSRDVRFRWPGWFKNAPLYFFF